MFEAGGLEACTRFFDFFPVHVQVREGVDRVRSFIQPSQPMIRPPRSIHNRSDQPAHRIHNCNPQRLALSVCVAICEGAAGQRREDAPRLLPAVPFLIKCLGLEDEQVK